MQKHSELKKQSETQHLVGEGVIRSMTNDEDFETQPEEERGPLMAWLQERKRENECLIGVCPSCMHGAVG